MVSRRNRLPVLALLAGLTAFGLATEDLDSQGRRSRRPTTVVINGHEAVEGEALVRVRPSALTATDVIARADVDADQVETVGRRGLRRLRSSRLGTRELLASLAANPDIELAEPNYIIRISATPNDPSFGNLWGLFNSGQPILGTPGLVLADIRATYAWERTRGSRANVVGVIDTGIDYNHPDLAANIWSAPRAFSVTVGGVVITCGAGTHGFNAITNSCDPMDDHSHGTHVAGTIGAVGNNGRGVAGVNWTASMMGLKFLSASGSGTTANAIKAIEFAIQAKAALGSDANVRILSNSWGGGGFSSTLFNQIVAANTNDMLFVAAAGNSASNNDVFPQYPASYAAANVVSVAATNNRDQRASFSSYGATSVHLGAPGESILSTIPGNGYAYYSGTSMATPHVSGAAALILSACSMTTASLKSALLSTVDELVSMSGITTTGGRLNVNGAVGQCTPPTVTVNGSMGAVTASTGATLAVAVANGPGNRGDWVTLVPSSAAPTHWSGTYQYLGGGTTRPTTGLTHASLTFAAPATPGTYVIRLFENDTWNRLATTDTITVNYAVPAIASLSPASVTAGGGATTVTIIGSGFTPVSTASVNGVTRATTFVSSTRLSIVLSSGERASPATFAVAVTNPSPGGGTSGNAAFTVTAATRINVNGSPGAVSATGGSPLFVDVLNGPANRGDFVMMVPTGSADNHWSGTYRYLNGSTTRPTTGSTNANLLFTAPLAGGTFEFRLFENDTWTRLATSAAVTVSAANAAPRITTIAPTSVVAGSGSFTLTVTGTGFVPASTVQINASTRPTTFVSSTTLTAALLSSDVTTAGTRAITVTTPSPGGGVSTSATLSVTVPVPMPSVTVNGSSSPITVNGGTTLTVGISNGPGNRSDFVMMVPAGAAPNHWSGIYQYLGGGAARPATGRTSASLAFAAPTGGGTFEFRLFENDSWSRLATSPVVTVNAANPTPVIATLSPATVGAGSSGFTLTVTGSGFVSGAEVRVNGAARATTVVSATSVTATILASDLLLLGSRAITVVNPSPGGGASNALTLGVQPATSATVIAVNGQVGPVTVAAGSTISVTIWNGPGNRSDWVTIVPSGAGATHWSGQYKYLSGTTTRPTTPLTTATVTFTAPASGTFEFRLFENDTWTLRAASGTVTIGS